MQKLGIKEFDYILMFSFEHILTLSLTSGGTRSVQSNRQQKQVLEQSATSNDNQCCDQWIIKQISHFHLVCFSIFASSSLSIFSSLYTPYMYKIFHNQSNLVIIQ